MELGIIINGKLYIGDGGGAGEIGHTYIRCGETFEELASMKALKNTVRQKLNLDESLSGREVMKILCGEYENISVKEQEIIDDIIEEYVKNLSIGILNVIKTLDVEKIVLGGSFAHYKELFLPRVIQKVKELNGNFESSYNYIIDVSKFNNDAGLIGASKAQT